VSAVAQEAVVTVAVVVQSHQDPLALKGALEEVAVVTAVDLDAEIQVCIHKQT